MRGFRGAPVDPYSAGMGEEVDWAEVFAVVVIVAVIAGITAFFVWASHASQRRNLQADRDRIDDAGLSVTYPTPRRMKAALAAVAQAASAPVTMPASPTASDLMRARRYREAARLVDAHDWDLRGELAILRGGPMADLMHLVEHAKDRGTKSRAHRTLGRLSRGHFGGLGNPEFGDDAAVVRHLAKTLLLEGRFVEAAESLEACLTAFPDADDAPEWRVTAAAARAHAGQITPARELAAAGPGVASQHHADALRNSDAGELLAALSRRLTAAEAAPDTPAPVRVQHRRWRDAATATINGLTRYPLRTPLYPGAARHALTQNGRKAGLAKLRLDTAREALATGHRVHLGLPTGRLVKLVDVLSVDPASQTVLLSTGTFATWPAVERLSYWGDYMVVSRRRAVTIPTEDVPDYLESPDLGRTTVVAGPDGWLTLMRDRVDAHPTEAPLAAAYLRALYEFTDPLPDLPTGAQFGAVCQARFSDAAWPRRIQAERSDGDGSAGWLHTLSLRTDEPRPGAQAAAMAALDISSGWWGWAQAEIEARADVGVLEASAHAALNEGRVDDATARIALMEKLQPDAPALPLLRSTAEVAADGPARVLARLDSHEQADLVTSMRLSPHTGDPHHISVALGRWLDHRPQDPIVFASRALGALHAGDPQAVAEAAAQGARAEGWSEPITLAVADALRRQATPDEALVMADILAPVAHFDAEHAWHIAWQAALGGHRDAAHRLLEPLAAQGITHAHELRAAVTLLDAPETGDDRLAALAHLEGADLEGSQRAALLASAAWATIDPDKAWALADVMPQPHLTFHWHLVIAAIASTRGDDELAERHLARASNAGLLQASGVAPRALGLDSWVATAARRIPIAAARTELGGLYGEDLRDAPVAVVPSAAERPVTTATLDRLANDGHAETYVAAAAHRYPASAQLAYVDGARGAAGRALRSALEGETGPLTHLTSVSRHPGIVAVATMWSRRAAHPATASAEVAS